MKEVSRDFLLFCVTGGMRFLGRQDGVGEPSYSIVFAHKMGLSGQRRRCRGH